MAAMSCDHGDLGDLLPPPTLPPGSSHFIPRSSHPYPQLIPRLSVHNSHPIPVDPEFNPLPTGRNATFVLPFGLAKG